MKISFILMATLLLLSGCSFNYNTGINIGGDIQFSLTSNSQLNTPVQTAEGETYENMQWVQTNPDIHHRPCNGVCELANTHASAKK